MTWGGSLYADQAQFFYDELGRLVGVVDGNGDLAVYTYDEVGNLLSITRPGQGGATIGLFLVAPASGLVGTSVTLQGFGFSAVTADNQVAFNGSSATVTSAEPGKKGQESLNVQGYDQRGANKLKGEEKDSRPLFSCQVPQGKRLQR